MGEYGLLFCPTDIPAVPLRTGQFTAANATPRKYGHATKASSRALINTSPEPFSNWTASVTEDVSVIAGLWTALHFPIAFIVLFVIFILAVIWLLPRLWRALKRVLRAVWRWFGGPTHPPPGDTDDTRASSPEPAPEGLSQRRRAVLRELYDDASGEGPR